MAPDIVARKSVKQLQRLFKLRLQASKLSIDCCGCVLPKMKGNIEMPSGAPPLFWVFSSSNQWWKMSLECRQCTQHFSSLHLWCLLFLKSVHLPVCLTTSGVYDEDSQWLVQVNRLQKLIDRLEQKVSLFKSAFFLPTSSLFLQLLVFNLTVSWHHGGHLKLTSLCQINHKLQHCGFTNSINKLTPPNSTYPRTNTCTCCMYSV